MQALRLIRVDFLHNQSLMEFLGASPDGLVVDPSSENPSGLVEAKNIQLHENESLTAALRTFARKFSNIDFFLKILPLKDDELVMSEM